MNNKSSLIVSPVELSIYFYILSIIIFDTTSSIVIKLSRVFLITMMVLYLLKRFSMPKYAVKYITWASGFLIYCFLGIRFAFSKSYAQSFTVTLMYVVICDIAIIIYASRNTYFVRKMVNTLVIGAVLKSLYVFSKNGLFAFLTSRSTAESSANTVGMVCAIGAALAFYEYRKNHRVSYGILLWLNIIFTILSASRKAILFLAIPIGVFIILKSNNPLNIMKNIFAVTVLAIIALICLLKINVLYDLIGNRLEGMIYGMLGIGNADASTATRMGLIADGMIWFRERPWFGYGLSNFKALCAIYRSWGTTYYAHNNYVELLVDCGIVGTSIYYYYLAAQLIAYLKKIKKLTDVQKLWLGILISALVCDYGMVTYFSVYSQLLIIISVIILNEFGYGQSKYFEY